MLKISAGPTGAEQKNTFVLKAERSIFNRSDDREVIVLFQWEGTPGPHKLAAQWRSPDGGQTSQSTIDYVARDRRFGAYWSLPLSPAVQVGHWSIEATVDGQPAGRFSFEVTDTKVTPAITRQALTQAALYERLTKMFTVLQRTSAAGRELDAAAGFWRPAGQLYTAMAAVDDTDRIRAFGPDGVPRDITTIIRWNRRQDWAILAGDAPEGPSTPVAEAIDVGDRCFSIEGGVTTGRVLLEGTISGKGAPGSGPLLLASFFTGTGTPGAPVLNEFGELIGLVGGANVPGATRLNHIQQFRAALKGVPIVPIALLRAAPGLTPVSMADLRAKGDLIASLAGEGHILSGGFARRIDRRQAIAPSEQRDEFSVREKGFVVFVTWDPQERLRGTTQLRIHDPDNRVVVESKASKASFSKDQLTLTSWEIPMLSKPDTYRADLLFNGKPMWRGFVRITP